MNEIPETPSPWGYALQVYAQPGVAEACLLLQTRYGVDVVVMLHAMYAFRVLGVRLDAATLDAAEDRVRAWREQVTLPLRSLRTALRTGFAGVPQSTVAGVRQKIKAAELDAEAAAFEVLAALTAGIPMDGNDAGQAEALLDAIVARYAPGDFSTRSLDLSSRQAMRALLQTLCATAPEEPQGGEVDGG